MLISHLSTCTNQVTFHTHGGRSSAASPGTLLAEAAASLSIRTGRGQPVAGGAFARRDSFDGRQPRRWWAGSLRGGALRLDFDTASLQLVGDAETPPLLSTSQVVPAVLARRRGHPGAAKHQDVAVDPAATAARCRSAFLSSTRSSRRRSAAVAVPAAGRSRTAGSEQRRSGQGQQRRRERHLRGQVQGDQGHLPLLRR